MITKLWKCLKNNIKTIPNDDGNDFQHSLIQTLTEVDQGATIGTHSAKHNTWTQMQQWSSNSLLGEYA